VNSSIVYCCTVIKCSTQTLPVSVSHTMSIQVLGLKTCVFGLEVQVLGFNTFCMSLTPSYFSHQWSCSDWYWLQLQSLPGCQNSWTCSGQRPTPDSDRRAQGLEAKLAPALFWIDYPTHLCTLTFPDLDFTNIYPIYLCTSQKVSDRWLGFYGIFSTL